MTCECGHPRSMHRWNTFHGEYYCKGCEPGCTRPRDRAGRCFYLTHHDCRCSDYRPVQE